MRNIPPLPEHPDDLRLFAEGLRGHVKYTQEQAMQSIAIVGETVQMMSDSDQFIDRMVAVMETALRDCKSFLAQSASMNMGFARVDQKRRDADIAAARSAIPPKIKVFEWTNGRGMKRAIACRSRKEAADLVGYRSIASFGNSFHESNDPAIIAAAAASPGVAVQTQDGSEFCRFKSHGMQAPSPDLLALFDKPDGGGQ